MTRRPSPRRPLLCLALLPCAWIQGAQAPPWESKLWREFVADPAHAALPDFSTAGYRHGDTALPLNRPVTANAREFGAIADDGKDDTAALQRGIDALAARGGGVLFFPKGHYDINVPGSGSAGFIAVKAGNIVLRGAGSGKDGTVLKLREPLMTKDGKVTVKGGTSFVRIGAGRKTGPATKVTANAARGSATLTVENARAFRPGDILRLTQGVGGKNTPKDKKGRFFRETCGVDFTQFPIPIGAAPRQSCFLEVAAVVDAHTLRLVTPLKIHIDTRYSPRVQRYDMLTGIGIEKLRITSNWNNDYKHHRSRFDDGGVGGIRFQFVAHSWLYDVAVDDNTQAIGAGFCKNLTIRKWRILGNGHFGVQLGICSDCLVEDGFVAGNRTHCITVTYGATGNVFRRLKFDPASPCAIDFHGGSIIPGTANLYEQIENGFVAAAGGAAPHAGPYNVFWNIVVPEKKLGYGFNEFFSAFFFYWSAYRKLGHPIRYDNHLLLPKSIVVGVHRQSGWKVEINRSTEDRRTDTITVEGLNRPGVHPASLHEAQRARRHR